MPTPTVVLSRLVDRIIEGKQAGQEGGVWTPQRLKRSRMRVEAARSRRRARLTGRLTHHVSAAIA